MSAAASSPPGVVAGAVAVAGRGGRRRGVLRHRRGPATALGGALLLPLLLAPVPAATAQQPAPAPASTPAPTAAPIAAPTGAAAARDSTAAALAALAADSAAHPWATIARTARVRAAVRDVYAGRDWTPLWLDSTGRLTPAGRAVPAALASAAYRGLRPDDYATDTLAERVAAAGHSPVAGARARAELDAALTLAIAALVADQRVGRADPRRLGFALPAGRPLADLARRLRMATADGLAPARVLVAAEPPLALYRRLADALPALRRMADTMPRVRLRAPGGDRRVVRTGEPYADAPLLRRLLAATGDLPGGSASVHADAVYDTVLATGVAAFQERHGLTADGVLGPATLAALAVPPARRVRQVELSLERLRWLADPPPGPLVAVNIPAFRLWAFDGTGPRAAPSLTMPVIVGDALDTQTPVFAGTMRTVVFRPYWNVPQGIAQKEILPVAARDSTYLARNRYELVRYTGARAEVVPATREAIARARTGALHVRQLPGGANSLGLVKLLFPNAYNVYLHDTPTPQLFARERRDLSHGCIRLARPAELVEFVLGRSGWTPERIAAAMREGPDDQSVAVQPPVSVLIFYATALVDERGRLLFFDDVYGHDARLETALR